MIETSDEKEIDYEALQEQKITILLDTLYQALQTHDSLKTISRKSSH